MRKSSILMSSRCLRFGYIASDEVDYFLFLFFMFIVTNIFGHMILILLLNRRFHIIKFWHLGLPDTDFCQLTYYGPTDISGIHRCIHNFGPAFKCCLKKNPKYFISINKFIFKCYDLCWHHFTAFVMCFSTKHRDSPLAGETGSPSQHCHSWPLESSSGPQ